MFEKALAKLTDANTTSVAARLLELSITNNPIVKNNHLNVKAWYHKQPSPIQHKIAGHLGMKHRELNAKVGALHHGTLHHVALYKSVAEATMAAGVSGFIPGGFAVKGKQKNLTGIAPNKPPKSGIAGKPKMRESSHIAKAVSALVEGAGAGAANPHKKGTPEHHAFESGHHYAMTELHGVHARKAEGALRKTHRTLSDSHSARFSQHSRAAFPHEITDTKHPLRKAEAAGIAHAKKKFEKKYGKTTEKMSHLD